MNYIIVGAKDTSGQTKDFYISNGYFVDTPPSNAEKITAEGLTILPGLVDIHTHLREPGKEDAETVASGTLAAAKGGFSAVCAMPNTNPVTDSAEFAEHVFHLGQAAANCYVAPIGAITRNLAGKELADLGLMHRSSANVNMFSDDGKCVMNAQIMRRALEWVKPFDGVIAQHCQDLNLAGPEACAHEGELSGKLGLAGWPSSAESIIIARDVQLAQSVNSRLHICHVSTAESVDVIRWAKARGIKVTAEVTPHHLLFDTSAISNYDTTYKVNPPLRTSEHLIALRQALADGTIDAVATDHAPHTSHDKDHAFVSASPGMIGLEQVLGVVIETMINSGLMNWETLVQRMSVMPARIAKLANQGRPLMPNEPANLVLVDSERRNIVDRNNSVSLARNNPYHGYDLPDPVELTIYHGKVTYRRDS